jgi:hypothetical protein
MHWSQNISLSTSPLLLLLSSPSHPDNSQSHRSTLDLLTDTIIDLLSQQYSNETIPCLNAWKTTDFDEFDPLSNEMLTNSLLTSLSSQPSYVRDRTLSQTLVKLCQSEPLLIDKLIERTFDLFTKAIEFTKTHLCLHESEHPYHIQKLESIVNNDLDKKNNQSGQSSAQRDEIIDTEIEIPNAKLVHRISINEANALFIYFDSKSKLNANDVLCFYADEQLCHLVRKYSQKNLPNDKKASPFYPLIVKEPYLWVTLEQEIGRRPPLLQQKTMNWGWKFVVFPTHVSFNVALWLLSFFVEPTHKELISKTGNYLKVLSLFFEFLLKHIIYSPIPQHMQQVILEILLHILHSHYTTKGDVASFLLSQSSIQNYLKQLESVLQESLKEEYYVNSTTTTISTDTLIVDSYPSHIQSLIQFISMVHKKHQESSIHQKQIQGTK